MYLTNENLLLMQSPNGQDAFAVVENFSTGASETVPIFRPSNEAWEQMHTELASRMNITPVHRRFFDNLPDEEDSGSTADFVPDSTRTAEVERQNRYLTIQRDLESIESIMDSLYKSMMSFPQNTPKQ